MAENRKIANCMTVYQDNIELWKRRTGDNRFLDAAGRAEKELRELVKTIPKGEGKMLMFVYGLACGYALVKLSRWFFVGLGQAIDYADYHRGGDL